MLELFSLHVSHIICAILHIFKLLFKMKLHLAKTLGNVLLEVGSQFANICLQSLHFLVHSLALSFRAGCKDSELRSI